MKRSELQINNSQKFKIDQTKAKAGYVQHDRIYLSFFFNMQNCGMLYTQIRNAKTSSFR